MPERDLGAQLRAYIDSVAEPVRPDEVVGARRRRPDATVRAIAVAAVFAAAAVAVAFVVITREGGADVAAPAAPGASDSTTTTAMVMPTIPPITSATAQPFVPPRVTDTIDVGGDPEGIAIVDRTVWVAVSGGAGGESAVVAVDADSRQVTTRYPVPIHPNDFAADASGLWVVGSGVHRVDPATGTTTTIVSDGMFTGVALAYGSLWAVRGGEVVRIDPATNEVVARITPVQGGFGVAAGAGSIWLSDGNHSGPNVITRIDPATNTVSAEIRVPSLTRRLVATDTAIYATVFFESPGGGDGGIYGVDPTTNQHTGQVAGGGWQGITLVGGYVWVVAHGGSVGVVKGDGTIEQLSFAAPGLPSSGDAIAFGAGAVWATAPEAGHLVRIDPGFYR